MAAATPLTVVTLATPWATALTASTFTAADATNGNSFACDGLTFLFAHNTAAGADYTITVSSAADADTKRTADVSDTILRSTYRVYQLFPINGWRQPDSTIFVKASNASVALAAIRIAAGAGFFGAV